MPRTLSPAEVKDFKQRLCAAAEKLLLSRGSSAFSMRELAAEVGCSPMLPYRYYRDKDDIIAAVRTAALTRFSEALEAPRPVPGDPVARSMAVGEAYIRFAFENPQLYRLMFSLEPMRSGTYPELDAALTRSRATMTAHVRDLVAAGLLHGDPQIIGHVFWASLHGLIVLQLAKHLEPEPGFAAIRAVMLEALIKGLRAPG